MGEHNHRHTRFHRTQQKMMFEVRRNEDFRTHAFRKGQSTLVRTRATKTCYTADLLILLSDIDGLYTADPHKDPNATLIKRITEINDDIMALAGDSSSTLGTGGMKTKLQAAKICMSGGCDMVIANGANPQILYDIMSDTAPNCTRFISNR